MRRPILGLLFGLLTTSSSAGVALAQCVNKATPTCDVYASCFAKYCSCGGTSEYFLKYGQKYCLRFLNNESFSAAARQWRDSTLLCLQESIVPHLDISANPQCDCAAMRGLAYRSHVACYTQKGASICDLDVGDVNAIRKVIDLADIFDSEGWKQMHEVARICEAKAPDAGRRGLWAAMELILRMR